MGEGDNAWGGAAVVVVSGGESEQARLCQGFASAVLRAAGSATAARTFAAFSVEDAVHRAGSAPDASSAFVGRSAAAVLASQFRPTTARVVAARHAASSCSSSSSCSEPPPSAATAPPVASAKVIAPAAVSSAAAAATAAAWVAAES